MYRITKEFVVEYAHRLYHHTGQCNYLHGHSGKVFVTLASEELQEPSGMIMDFSDLKDACAEIVGKYDHSLVLNQDDPFIGILDNSGQCLNIIDVPGEPTAENFARWIFDALKEEGFPVKEVTFYETAKNSATYSE